MNTQSGFGDSNPQPKPQAIERTREVEVAPEPITMEGVQAMVRMMLDQQMRETRCLIQQSKDELTVPVRQAPALEATIWVAKSVGKKINDRIANKVEVGKKRKFEGSSRSNRKNLSSQSRGGRGKAKWCNRKCPKEVTCFKCGKIGHNAHKCSTKEEVCLKCSGVGHFKQDCPMRATTPNVLLKHYEGYDEKVTCYKCGRIGHYASKCMSKSKVCYGCNKEGHLRRDCPKRHEAADKVIKSED